MVHIIYAIKFFLYIILMVETLSIIFLISFRTDSTNSPSQEYNNLTGRKINFPLEYSAIFRLGILCDHDTLTSVRRMHHYLNRKICSRSSFLPGAITSSNHVFRSTDHRCRVGYQKVLNNSVNIDYDPFDDKVGDTLCNSNIFAVKKFPFIRT